MPKLSAGACAKPPEFDWRKLVAAKEGEISRLSNIYEANLHKAGVEVFEERAEILGPHEVRLIKSGQRRHRANISWSPPAPAPQMLPAFPDVEHAISSNEIFDLPKTFRNASPWSAAAISRWSSPAFSRGSARM